MTELRALEAGSAARSVAKAAYEYLASYGSLLQQRTPAARSTASSCP